MEDVYLCPKCGSGKLEILHDVATCQSCGTQTSMKELLVTKPQAPDSSITEVLGTTDTALRIAQEVSRNYLLLLSELASAEIGKAMVRAGVVGGKEDPKVLGRIIRAATLAAHEATLREINTIQLEKMKKDDSGN